MRPNEHRPTSRDVRANNEGGTAADYLARTRRVSRRAKRWLPFAGAFALLSFLILPAVAIALGVVSLWMIVADGILGMGFEFGSIRSGLSSIAIGLFLAVASYLFGVMSWLVIVSFQHGMESFEDDDGVLLGREDLPELFAVLDDLCAACSTPPLDAVALTGDANAFALQEDGPNARRVLGIGAPLLMLLSPERTLAVIAHELGHFAQEDGRAFAWTHRFQRVQLEFGMFSEEISGLELFTTPARLVVGLGGVAVDYAMARCSRANELTADAFSSVVVGREVTAETLIVIGTLSAEADRAAWGPLREAYHRGEDVPHDLVGTLPRRVLEAYNKTRMKELLKASENEVASIFDSHPTMRERVNALGQPLALPSLDPDRASWNSFLGSKREEVVRRMEEHLRARLAAGFEERREEVRRTRELMTSALEAIDAAAEPSEAGETAARLMLRSLPFDEVRPQLEALAERFPDGPEVDGVRRVGVPAARAALLENLLLDGDASALPAAVSVLRRARALRFPLYRTLWCIHEGEIPERLTHLREAIAADDELTRNVRGALAAQDNAFTLHYSLLAGSKPLPLRGHGLADWHVAMIVNELQGMATEAGARLTEVGLVRDARDHDGAPAFYLFARSDSEPFLDDDVLEERLSLPGECVHMPLKAGEKAERRWRPIVEHPSAIIFATNYGDERAICTDRAAA